MRRFQALLIVAGLAAAPASAVAGPSHDSWSPQTFEKFEFSTSKGRLGVMVMSLTPELRKHFGAAEDRGVLVAHVEPGTPAAAAGITVGDIIVEVRGKVIDGASDVLSALAELKKGQHATIEVVRDGKPRSIEATLSNDPSPNLFDPNWSGMRWLQELMKPLEPQKQTASPFEEDWFHHFHELLHPAKPNETSLHS
jgi:membrane-associated protease RseP (regulator of RpoE activity)